jgi:phospholipase/carboxylesterase
MALPSRTGPRPRTTPTNPHTQLDQLAPAAMQAELARRLFALDGVVERPSMISVPGARALWLADDVPAAGPGAFMIGREFAHVHPPYDGSLHAALPPALAEEAISAGWAEPHPMALRGVIPRSIVMLYGPRDPAELDVIVGLVEASLAQARR